MARSFASGDNIAYSGFTQNGTANTVAIWFYQTVAQASSVYYGICGNHGGSPYLGGILSGGAGGGNKIAYYWAGSGIDSGPNSFSNNVWNHAAFVVSASGTATAGYLNGVANGTGTTWTTTGTNTMNLGYVGVNGKFVGYLADFAFWSGVALSAGEIAALATGTARPYQIRPSQLQIYSPLDGYGHPALDRSFNNNNGVLTGTTLAVSPTLINAAPIMLTTVNSGEAFLKRSPLMVAAALPKIKAAAAASTIKFRKTLSQIGGRVGSRQIQGWAN